MNNSLKNLTIVGLLIVALVEGGYIIKNRNTNSAVITQRTTVSAEPEKAPAKTDLPMLKKGDKLADSAIAKMAYKIAPGDLSTDATKAITGFTMARVINTDGSIVVKLTPRESEYQYQQYAVKPGETLYFVEAAWADDKETENLDANLRDDYGVLVDSNGLVL